VSKIVFPDRRGFASEFEINGDDADHLTVECHDMDDAVDVRLQRDQIETLVTFLQSWLAQPKVNGNPARMVAKFLADVAPDEEWSAYAARIRENFRPLPQPLGCNLADVPEDLTKMSPRCSRDDRERGDGGEA